SPRGRTCSRRAPSAGTCTGSGRSARPARGRDGSSPSPWNYPRPSSHRTSCTGSYSRIVAALQALTGIPQVGRTFTSSRRVRLGDMDPRGRLRLDALARYLQDAAIDDVDETGWGSPEHLWVLRHVRIDVVRPFLEDREVVLQTWCSGVAALAAGRRWSVAGDRGGAIEVDSVWIHLGPDGRPARLDGFGAYADSAGSR